MLRVSSSALLTPLPLITPEEVKPLLVLPGTRSGWRVAVTDRAAGHCPWQGGDPLALVCFPGDLCRKA